MSKEITPEKKSRLSLEDELIKDKLIKLSIDSGALGVFFAVTVHCFSEQSYLGAIFGLVGSGTAVYRGLKSYSYLSSYYQRK